MALSCTSVAQAVSDSEVLRDMAAIATSNPNTM
jgi:hypothetical protein